MPENKTDLDMLELTEDALIGRLGVVLGYTPVGTRDLLHVLTHPDVIAFTNDYIAARKVHNTEMDE